MAFGQLGWTKERYLESSPYEFFAACEGYFDKQKHEAQLHRATAFIMYRSLGGKENIERVWPMASDKKVHEKIVLDDEMRKNIIDAYKIKLN